MSRLITNLPAQHVYVRKEYLRDLRDGHGESLRGVAETAMKIGPQRCWTHRAALTTTQGYCDMADRRLPAPDVLRKLLRYDPETGVLVWLPRPISDFPRACSGKTWNSRYAGKSAMVTLRDGYYTGTILGRTHLTHRVAWAIHHGVWPDGDIDHINHIRTDNRLCNLRVVDDAINSKNQSLPKNNKSGIVGVCWRKRTKKWRAYIRVEDRNRELGSFDTLAAAAAARAAAEIKYGYHPNHGRGVA